MILLDCFRNSFLATLELLRQPRRIKRVARTGAVILIIFSVWIPTIQQTRWLFGENPLSYITDGIALFESYLKVDAKAFTDALSQLQAYQTPILIGVAVLAVLALILSTIFHYVLVGAVFQPEWSFNDEYRSFRYEAAIAIVCRLAVAIITIILGFLLQSNDFSREHLLSSSLFVFCISVPLLIANRLIIEFCIPVHHSYGVSFPEALKTVLAFVLMNPVTTGIFLLVRWIVAQIILVISLIVTSPLILITVVGPFFMLWQFYLKSMTYAQVNQPWHGMILFMFGGLLFMLSIFFLTWLIFIVISPAIMFLRRFSLEFLVAHELFPRDVGGSDGEATTSIV